MTKIKQICDYLNQNDNYLILMHGSPDGDAVGSAYALCRALRALGKSADCACCDPLPRRYSYMLEGVENTNHHYEHILTVDVADPKLLGGLRKEYGDRIEVAIDHHASNVEYAELSLVLPEAAAACEVIYDVICALGVAIDRKIAECLFTGIATDTGCFKFSNTTATTHRIAANLIEKGIDAGEINRIMFDTKSFARLDLERRVIEKMEILDDGKIAVLVLTAEMQEGLTPDDLEGINALSRQIEGVIVGITLREKEANRFKASVRTYDPVDASVICRNLGGGGHIRAAGCELKMPFDEARDTILAAVREELNK